MATVTAHQTEVTHNRLLEIAGLETGALGKLYRNGEIIVRQGERGECMFVIQAGQVEIVTSDSDKHSEIRLAVLREKDFFGEMEVFDREVRSATVRALGDARILTVDRKNFLRRVHEDPSFAYRIMEEMSHRIRQLIAEVTRLKGGY